MQGIRKTASALIAVIATVMLSLSLFILISIQKSSSETTENTEKPTTDLKNKESSSEGSQGIIVTVKNEPICPESVLRGKVASSPSFPLKQKVLKKGIPALLMPIVRLEFSLNLPAPANDKRQQNTQIFTTQFSSQTKKELSLFLDYLSIFYFKLEKAKDLELKRSLKGVYLDKCVNMSEVLQRTQIDSPDGKRRICEEEAWEVVNFLSHSAEVAMEQFLTNHYAAKPAT
jgi:hypothetical protein